ncbi:orotidine-5'-phosphate decarboxylase [Bhargavaea ginsengi]|uniref:Orotidine 5'-phosphate decarboxylase n=1 Tax=Bhargavaea ginsengi TaxID=426757 RepID=A0A1H6STY8_9BACL|nr:orotidine-5'-phosphate decarboxylase [Bhargavaea ginsengi]SEI71221.1 orotidine-5'-phosphate decarboxylase [Bhargavaea ginsengi]
MNRSPIIALDFPAPDDAYAFLRNMPSGLCVKVGMELYLQNGPDVVGRLKEMGHEVFLDLKLHDIPNTVGRAMEGLARVGADMVNVHAAGGSDMMKRALDGLEAGTPAGKKRPALIAVTQLTSTGEGQMNSEQGIPGTLLDSVIRYARLADDSGLDGVVCSVLEASAIRDACGENFLKVTPGIRMADGDLHDQKRVSTPTDAARAGSTHIVVGRAITQAADPAAAYETVKRLWEER